MGGATRFTELRSAIPDISDRMLCARLKALEAEGIVARHVFAETPVRVEYHLTEKGQALKKVFAAIGAWADEWSVCQSHPGLERPHRRLSSLARARAESHMSPRRKPSSTRTAPSGRSTARPSRPARSARRARRVCSSCISTPRGGCTSISGWRWRACFRSWAVPKGPSYDTGEKRLAVHVEDHPLEYGDFEGLIPEGNYGAGAVIVWDRGEWIPVGDPLEGLDKGKLLFELRGYKLRGMWTLVKIKKTRRTGSSSRSGTPGPRRSPRGCRPNRCCPG